MVGKNVAILARRLLAEGQSLFEEQRVPELNALLRIESESRF